MINTILRIAFFIIYVCLFSRGAAYAQSQRYELTGSVYGHAGKTLSSATVLLEDLNGRELVKTVTGEKGEFKIILSSAGKYVLIIKYTGYDEFRTAALEAVSKDFGKMILTPGSRSLDEVVIQSKKELIEFDGSSIIYNVSKSIDAQGTSVLEALKKAPGVYIGGDNSITLNGKQGTMILIDGKQTYLSGKEITDLLQSMPSSGIKSIEIINSPTAKYDAAGSAGIINIRTNKSQVKGFNGTATTGLIYGLTAKHVQDLSFNYRKDKLNVFGGYSHFLGHYGYLYGSERQQNDKFYNSHTDDVDKRKKMGGRVGLDYNIDDKNTVGILVNTNFLFGGGITDTETKIGSPPSSDVEQVLRAVNDYYSQLTERYNVSLNYKYEDTLGRIFNIDADYGQFDKSNGNLQSNAYFDPQNSVISENLYRTLNDIHIKLYGFKFDYTTNLWRGKLESGAKYSSIAADNNSRFFHLEAQLDSLDDRRSNNFIYDERIASGYLNYKRSVGKWSLQAGLRLENTASEGMLKFRSNQADSAENIRRNYTNLFPALSVSFKPAANHNWSLAYSRRIDRPAYQELNPFVYLLDELSFWQGNPFLQPQLSHRVALQYAYKSSTIVGLTFARTDQFSANITDTLEAEKIVMLSRNLGIQNHLSLSLTQNITPVKWWDVTFNGVLYYIHNDIAFDQYRNLNLKQLAGRLNLQQSFKLPYKLTGEVSAMLVSKRLSGANTIARGISQVDLGLQKSLLNNRATVRLVYNDIYKGNQSKATQNVEGLSLRTYGYYESRQFRLNFTYKFANSSLKGPRNRNSALENENNRIK